MASKAKRRRAFFFFPFRSFTHHLSYHHHLSAPRDDRYAEQDQLSALLDGHFTPKNDGNKNKK